MFGDVEWEGLVVAEAGGVDLSETAFEVAEGFECVGAGVGATGAGERGLEVAEDVYRRQRVELPSVVEGSTDALDQGN